MDCRFHHMEGQEHSHTHHGAQGGAAGKAPLSAEKTAAVLRYMVEHNEHHAGELEELAGGLEGAAAEKLAQARETFRRANAELKEVLRMISE